MFKGGNGGACVEMMVLLMGLERMGVVVSFCSVSSHVGVEGNEKADLVERRGRYSGPPEPRGSQVLDLGKRARSLAKGVGS